MPLLVACGGESQEPISAATLALTAQQNVERALRGTHAAGSFIADSATLAKMLSSVSGSSCESSAGESEPCPAGAVCPPVEGTATCLDNAVTVEDLEESRQELTEAIDDFVKSLREEVFTAEHLESEDGTSATYLLGPDYFCSSGGTGTPIPTPGGTTDVAPEPTLDAACVERAEKLQPRLRLTSPSAGNVDVQLLLTPEKRNPATVELRTDGVGVVLDLAEIKASLDALELDTEGLASMSGKLAFELHRNAELDYSFRFNVLSTLDVATIDDLAQQVAFSLAGSSPSVELRLDGNARTVTGTYDFGKFGVKGPLNAFRDWFDDEAPVAAGEPVPTPVTYTGLVELLVGGLDGSVVLDGDDDTIQLRALGLGDVSSTLKHDGTTLARLDLNPNHGRHFDLTVARDAEDQTTLTFSPTFDLGLLANFAPLATQISDIPSYLLSDTLRVWFDGESPSIRSEAEQIRVLSGTLNVTSASTPEANLRVAAGSCLADAEVASSSHEVLGELSAGVCR